jgi:hypothetical protein
VCVCVCTVGVVHFLSLSFTFFHCLKLLLTFFHFRDFLSLSFMFVTFFHWLSPVQTFFTLFHCFTLLFAGETTLARCEIHVLITTEFKFLQRITQWCDVSKVSVKKIKQKCVLSPQSPFSSLSFTSFTFCTFIHLLSPVNQLWWGVKFTFSACQCLSKASYKNVERVSFNNSMQTNFLTFFHFCSHVNQVSTFEIRIQ